MFYKIVLKPEKSVGSAPAELVHSTIRLTIMPVPGMIVDMDTPLEHDLDLVFAALADPTRRRILTMLLEDDMAVSDVAEPFTISLAAISKHLAILARAGLIAQEKRGRVKWCALQMEAMREALVWMESFGQLKALDLDDFERFLAIEIDG